jgi:hypothetical protein
MVSFIVSFTLGHSCTDLGFLLRFFPIIYDNFYDCLDYATQPSQKSFRTKRILAKKGKQNRWGLSSLLEKSLLIMAILAAVICLAMNDNLTPTERSLRFFVINYNLLPPTARLQTRPTMVPTKNRLQDPIQRKEETLETYQTQHLIALGYRNGRHVSFGTSADLKWDPLFLGRVGLRDEELMICASCLCHTRRPI